MVKKFLLSAAVVGALATSAMAYDYIPKTMTFDTNLNLSNGIVNLNGNKGNALIYPAFFAQQNNGMNWASTVNVINTSKDTAIAKVVLFRGDDSKEILDFNIGLSPNDEWQAHIYVDEDGHPHIVSKDKSGIVDRVLKINNPDGTVSYPQNGYIEIIGMAAVSGVDLEGTDITNDFEKDVEAIRNLQGDVQYDNGVPTAPIKAPYVNLSKVNVNTTYSYKAVSKDALIGTIRVTDTANNKDMVLNAIGLDLYNNNNAGLLYLEGESANIGDICLKPIKNQETRTDVKSLQYDADSLVKSLDNIVKNKKSVYMTYGKAEPQNMYALFTTPLKRLIFRGVDTDYSGSVALKTDGLYYNNNLLFAVQKGLDATQVNNEPTDFSFNVYTKIYNMDEAPVKDTFYSPATTPAININHELQSSGTDYTNKHTLAYYIKEAQKNDSSYKEGFIILKNTVYGQIIPAIVTQMLATKANENSSQYITNWITPVSY